MGIIDPMPTQARLTRAEIQAQARRLYELGVSGSTKTKTQPQEHGSDRSGAPIVLAIVLVVLVGLFLAYISLSDGVDYVHGFGRACVVAHDGWHFHLRCGSVSPPKA